MMTANLVGFAVGIDGVKKMLPQIFNWGGLGFVFLSFLGLYVVVHVMFEIRNNEKLNERSVRY